MHRWRHRNEALIRDGAPRRPVQVVVTLLVLLASLAVAYTNGANDNFKGAATLYGSHTASYSRALVWATLTTLAGALVSVVLADQLVKTFSGAGLLPKAIVARPAFLASATAGAAGAVLLATMLGLPVSTTHALMGSLVGSGLVNARGDLSLGVLGTKFVLPLVVSPFLSALLTVGLYKVFTAARRALDITSDSCVCIGGEVAATCSSNSAALTYIATHVVTGPTPVCVQRYRGAVVGVSVQRLVDAVHYISGGAMSFARGLNDAPKIVALVVAGQLLGVRNGLTLVAVVMAAGGLLSARRVAHTIATKVTQINSGQGVTASMITAALVIAASTLGLPVSTTHVSIGALFGIGAVSGTANVRTIGTILTAWIVTFPIALGFGAVMALALR
jgi:PiT family inorganic phosphate transporter